MNKQLYMTTTQRLRDHVAGEAGDDIESLIERLEARCQKLTVEPPTPDRINTIFRCVGWEINEGLNVAVQWNGAADFMFFAHRGEMTSNCRDNHEVSMLALHLIQNYMVYVNTLMIQAQPCWRGRFTPRDYAALTPLIWEHVNLSVRFDLDMHTRLDLL